MRPGRIELLNRINKDVPPGVDWKAGARRYVENCFGKMGREYVESYSMTKPFLTVGDDPVISLAEMTHYLQNFANALSLIHPPKGSRFLDVACGGGWVSHYLSKLGYWTYGIDISADFIDLAIRRLSSDPSISVAPAEARERFQLLDVEADPIPKGLHGTFDYVWMESCLHHFHDPLSALQHLADALKPEGVLILIEFENQVGGIKDQYMQVMKEFDTLERPYVRADLEAALDYVGLTHREFVAALNGWFSPDAVPELHMRPIADAMNIAVCAKTTEPIDRLFG